ncbi:unnamed protein product [Urochloa humidicola]
MFTTQSPETTGYRNLPGVKTRVMFFGTTQSFRFNNSARKNVWMEGLVKALKGSVTERDQTCMATHLPLLAEMHVPQARVLENY